MARLTYGDGNCSVDGNCRAIQIEYRGAIQIMDKTPNNFAFHLNSHRIIIYPLGQGLLTDLFDYKGEFKIISVNKTRTDKQQETIKRFFDWLVSRANWYGIWNNYRGNLPHSFSFYQYVGYI